MEASSASVSADSLAISPEPGDIAGLRADLAPLEFRRGHEPDGAFAAMERDVRGGLVIHGEELDRFEIRLGGDSTHRYSAHLRSGEALAPLPIGSRLHDGGRRLTWQPGVGFVGPYDFVFVRWEVGRAVARQDIRIALHARGSSRVGPQIFIDTPRPGHTLSGPFIVAGWAADLDDLTGTGVDAVHVWAYPADGGPPEFLGAASYGGHRPDVAALLGSRLDASGYGLRVHGLVPGTYDVAVFAWSTVRQGFVDAVVVRVDVR